MCNILCTRLTEPLEKAFRAVKVCIEKKALVLPPLRAGAAGSGVGALVAKALRGEGDGEVGGARWDVHARATVARLLLVGDEVCRACCDMCRVLRCVGPSRVAKGRRRWERLTWTTTLKSIASWMLFRSM